MIPQRETGSVEALYSDEALVKSGLISVPQSVIDLEEEAQENYIWPSRKEQIIIAIVYTIGIDNLFIFTSFSKDRKNYPNIIQIAVIYVIFAAPLLYMELFLGQYTQLGSLHLGKCSPVAHGVGVSMLCLAAFQTLIESAGLCNCLIYLIFCCSSELPWLSCGPDPEDKDCLDDKILKKCIHTSNCKYPATQKFSADIYYRKKVLETSDTEHSIGDIVWRRAAFMMLVWMVPFYPALKGPTWIRQVMQVLLIVIVIILVILLVWVGVQPGVEDGLLVLVDLDLDTIISIKAWSSAVEYCFMRLDSIQAGHILFGTYMTKNNHSDIDAILLSVISLITTLVGAVFSHAVVGVLAKLTGMNLSKVILEGGDITFTMIPQLLGVLPIPHLFTPCFYMLCVFLAFGNQAMQVNVICETIIEALPMAKIHRNYIVLIICGASYFSSMLFLTTTNRYNMRVVSFDMIYLSAETILLVLTVAVMYIYGVQRFSDDIHFMLGFQPTLFWKITWMAMPIFLSVALINALVDGIYVKAASKSLTVVFTAIFVLNLGPIILGAGYKLFKYLKHHNVIGFLKPEEDWGPRDPIERKLRSIFNPRQEIRSRRRVDACQHHCIINSIALKRAIFVEERCSRKVTSQEQIGTSETDNTMYE